MTNDYMAWGEAYLRDAAVLRRKIDASAHGRRFTGTDAEKKRLRTLYEMYLECVAVGNLLQRRARRMERDAQG